MNNRIRELVNQADIEVAHMECNRSRTQFEIKQQWVEKFAELIVRECADIVALRPYIDDGTWNHPSIMIKKHFGVE